MKSASKVMYTIGRVFNVIAIICVAIVIAIGAFALARSGDVAAQSNGAVTQAQAHSAGLFMVISASISFVVYIVLMILATHASKALDNGRKDSAPHILMLIIGIFGDIFYLLGGIFGLIAENSQDNAPANN